MALTFDEVLDYCQAIALQNKLRPSDESIWRSICRDYSIKFNTKLTEVLSMDPEHVILTHYESQLDEVNIEDNYEKLLDMIYSLQDPEYAKQKANELYDYIKQAEREETERVKAGRPIHKGLRHASELNQETKLPEAQPGPSQGHIDLSYLDKEEQEGGFDD